MPDRHLLNLTPRPAAAAQVPRRWRAVGELGQWLSIRNNVSRRIGQSARTVGRNISAPGALLAPA